jgi:DNA-binding transcriptional ArsR family regulator
LGGYAGDVTRTRAVDLDEAAYQALMIALEEAELEVERVGNGIALSSADHGPFELAVHGASVVDQHRAERMVRERPPRGRAVPFVVADKIVEPGRTVLDAAGWSWFDRRGHLRLRAPGLTLDLDAEPRPRHLVRHDPTRVLASRSGQEVAVALLLDPAGDGVGVRELARSVDLAPSSISRALKTLRQHGLVRDDGRPVLPDLFWSLSEHWSPHRVALTSSPQPDDSAVEELGANLGDLDSAGWAVGDTRAALAWGAPVAASRTIPVALYVPLASLHPVLDRWGSGSTSTFGVPTVAAAPVVALLTTRRKVEGEPWPVVHPLFAALDLAADPARGHQVLDEWTPQEVDRVW